MRFLVDVDVVLDYLDNSKELDGSARKLMILGYLREFELWMSATQALDLFYVLARGDRAGGPDEAKKALRHLRRVVRFCSLTETDVDAALDSNWDDLECACIHQCALKLKADAIIVRDKGDFEKSSVKVFGCNDLFAYLADEKGRVYEEVAWG